MVWVRGRVRVIFGNMPRITFRMVTINVTIVFDLPMCESDLNDKTTLSLDK